MMIDVQIFSKVIKISTIGVVTAVHRCCLQAQNIVRNKQIKQK